MTNKSRFFLFRFLLIPFLLIGLFASFLQASPGKKLEDKVISFRLENGLQVLLLPRHVSPTVSFYIRYRSGAVDDGDGKTGTAHFLEHLMFKGTKTIGTRNFLAEDKILRQIAVNGEAMDDLVAQGEAKNKKEIDVLKKKLKSLQDRHKALILSNEIDRLYTENGAVSLNASTGQDITTYHVSLPANKIELWARIESDRMANPVFREFYQERDVVLEERRQRVESDPDSKLYEVFLNTAFAAHPYKRPIIGWTSDIGQLRLKDLEAFFRRHHAPNNTVIAVVGDMDPRRVRPVIEKYFGKMKKQAEADRRISEEPRQIGEKRVAVHLEANPQMIIGYHKPAPPAYDDYVLEVIESILSRGRTSRFYKTLVEERGLAEDVSVSNGTPGSRYPNLFAIFATPRHPHGNTELEAAIYEMIEILKKEPVSQAELEKIKNQVRADFIRRQSSNEGLAGMLSYYQALLGDFRYMTTYADIIEKITADDIMRVSGTYLKKDNRTVAALDKK